jgi:F-type H+-transporting ATPase subunit b
MDQILRQLGELLLKAIPTFLLVVFLSFYLKRIFFKPLEKVLAERYAATEGARKLAEDSLERASAKAAEYEAAMREARADVYRQQEQIHKQLQEQAAAQIAEARKRSEAAVQAAKQELAQEAEAAKASLARESDQLAVQIADTVLRRSAA